MSNLFWVFVLWSIIMLPTIIIFIAKKHLDKPKYPQL